jgi:hypothetical protein
LFEKKTNKLHHKIMTFLPVGDQTFMQICDLVAQGIGRFRLD